MIDSTPLGEALDAESYRRMLSRYFIEVSRVLEHHGGTVEKFIGDAVMAVFGIPVVHEDDALRAVRAVTELREALHALNEELRVEFGMELRVRTGINTGEVVAGDPAEGQAFATGSAVATAQRLEAAASPGEILIGDSTYRLVREAVARRAARAARAEREGAARACVAPARRPLRRPAFARRLDSPMVGRDRELGRLRTAFEEAAQTRECRVISVIGTAGIGKSRLVKELLASVDDEASVLVGRCIPYGKGITYWPLRDLVRRAAGELTRERIEELLDGEPDAEKIAGRRRRRDRDRRQHERARGDDVGGAPAARAPGARTAARDRLRRPAVGRTDLPRPDRVPARLDRRRTDSDRLPGSARAARAAPRLARRDAERVAIVLDPLSEAEAEALLELLSGEQELTADLFVRITRPPRGTRSTSSRCSRC